jgi:hypothetical protein
MGKRGVNAVTYDEAIKLNSAELDQQIALAQWRVGAMSNASLRSTARKWLRMLEQVKAEREVVQNS